MAFLGIAGLACAGFLAFLAMRGHKPAAPSRVEADGFAIEASQAANAKEEPLSKLRDAMASGPFVLGTRFVPPPPAVSTSSTRGR